MPELLISGGCSFSTMSPGYKFINWPRWLSDGLGLTIDKTCHTGRIGQGNGLISRHVIFQVEQALKRTLAENLLVGIVWSGPWRHDFFDEIDIPATDQYSVDVIGKGSTNWRIINHHWQDEHSSLFYRHFGSYTGSVVNSYEHILRTQWYLSQRRVPYFMSVITEEVLPVTQRQHAEIGYLHDMIDFDHFLPISHGLFEWARDHSGLAFADHDPGHLTSDQNRLFTEQIILPFLRERNYV